MSAAITRLPAGIDCIIALGSNVGDKPANIARAVELLTEAGDVRLVTCSRNFATPPWGKPTRIGSSMRASGWQPSSPHAFCSSAVRK